MDPLIESKANFKVAYVGPIPWKIGLPGAVVTEVVKIPSILLTISSTSAEVFPIATFEAVWI